MKHWFVDDDSDHALMRITVPGHLKNAHRRLASVSCLDLLKDKAVADAYRTTLQDVRKPAMEICPVAGADSQVQVDAVFENMANVIRRRQCVNWHQDQPWT
jgi:hypothetical protein